MKGAVLQAFTWDSAGGSLQILHTGSLRGTLSLKAQRHQLKLQRHDAFLQHAQLQPVLLEALRIVQGGQP